MIRSKLAVVALVCATTLPLACGRKQAAPGLAVNTTLADQDPIAIITKLGGKVETRLHRTFVPPNPDKAPYYAVDLQGAKLTDDDLAVFSRMQGLDVLNLASTSISNEGLKHLTKLKAFGELDLTGTKITDEAIPFLRDIDVHSLSVANTGLTTEGLKQLRFPPRVCKVALGKNSQYRVYEEYRANKLWFNKLMIGGTGYGKAFPRPGPDTFNPDGKDRSRQPTTYYHPHGPVGQIMAKWEWFRGTGDLKQGDARLPASLVGQLANASLLPFAALVNVHSEPAFAVIRLNVGTHAAYARPYQQMHFYNNAPELAKFSLPPAGQPRYFHYIHDAIERGACVSVIEGNERTTLAQKGPKQFYSALFVEITRESLRDVNFALFTKEAMLEFMESLTEEGILCYHVSHRYHDFAPPLADAAKSLGLSWMRAEDDPYRDKFHDETHFWSTWVMVARQARYLAHFQNTKTITWEVPRSTGKHLWRDGEKPDVKPLERKLDG